MLVEEMLHSARNVIFMATTFPHLLHEQAPVKGVLVVQRFFDLLSRSHANKITFAKLVGIIAVGVPLHDVNRLPRFFTVNWTFFWNTLALFEPGLLPKT
jgi:hypothetical protein